jgi:hypothetical protein
MQQFEQDWLEVGSGVARSLHYPAPPEPPTPPGGPGQAKEGRAGAPRSGPGPGGDQCRSAHGNAAHDA